MQPPPGGMGGGPPGGPYPPAPGAPGYGPSGQSPGYAPQQQGYAAQPGYGPQQGYGPQSAPQPYAQPSPYAFGGQAAYAGQGWHAWTQQQRMCPRCTYPLQVRWDPSRVQIDHCFRCGGTFLDFGEAGYVVGAKADPHNWRPEIFTRPPQPGPLACPAGHGPMWTYLLGWDGTHVEIDACSHCRGMWLDANEAQTLDKITKEAHAEHARPGSDAAGTAGVVGMYVLQLATFLPVEVYNPTKRKALLVRGLVIALCAIFVVEFAAVIAGGPEIIRPVAFVPDLFESGYVWQVVTYAFLHGGLMHIAGNLYSLWIFGDNVEDRLGRGRFTVLYLAAAIAGALGHWLGNLHGTEPMVGASGAIAGLMGAYAVLFPRVKLWIVFFFVQFKIRAIWYMAMWVVLNLLLVLDPKNNVAWLAHIGGFVVGAGLAFVLKPKEEPLPGAPGAALAPQIPAYAGNIAPAGYPAGGQGGYAPQGGHGPGGYGPGGHGQGGYGV